ncbi:MAG: cupin domain-containing protein [Hydrotalea sp.]|nr:cupin domain-containing protein [Hydrotalea sp.]
MQKKSANKARKTTLIISLVAVLVLMGLVLKMATAQTQPAQPGNGGTTRDVITTTDKAWDGSGIYYPLSHKDKITAVKITIKEHGATPWHYHQGRTLGYVLQGTLRLEKKDGAHKEFKAGDVVVETINTVHHGVNVGKGDLVLIVFFSVDKDKPLSNNI